MKTSNLKLLIAVNLFACGLLPSVFGQGALTPPGAPAPTMKTLDQIEARTPVASVPFTITNSGSYYLTTNLTGVAGTNGITIMANDVTVDLNGFALLGVPGSQDGINIGGPMYNGYTNITVINGAIQGWGRYGIGGSIYNGSFKHVQANLNASTGFNVGRNSVVRECTATGNGSYGFYGSPYCIFESCVAQGNGNDGIEAGGSRVLNCLVSANGGSGIWAYGESFVSGCLSEDNAWSGIGLGSDSVAVNNTCSGNNNSGNSSQAGIRQFFGPGRIEGNHVSYSAGVGILVNAGQTQVVVIKNTTAGNTNNAYSIPAGNDVGPWGQAATATSPWANIRN
ncbi:MAG TPA: right-handed parallel beta-helix repeat-containing protein [Verrucomicrobiae bacterium]